MALVVNLNEIEDPSVNIDKEGDFILKIIEVKQDGFDKNGNIKVKISYAGFDKTDAEKNMLNHSELYFIAPYSKIKIVDLFAGLKVDNSVALRTTERNKSKTFQQNRRTRPYQKLFHTKNRAHLAQLQRKGKSC